MKTTKTRKNQKALQTFNSEERERNFWAREDSADYLDWTKARRVVFPNLKPSLRTISLRLPATLIARLKLLAHKRDVPYQSLLKSFLAERVSKEMEARGGS
jgi:predicted DNA binding CopG/RHH family protein